MIVISTDVKILNEKNDLLNIDAIKNIRIRAAATYIEQTINLFKKTRIGLPN